jgi:hypothetical protein
MADWRLCNGVRRGRLSLDEDHRFAVSGIDVDDAAPLVGYGYELGGEGVSGFILVVNREAISATREGGRIVSPRKGCCGGGGDIGNYNKSVIRILPHYGEA